MIAARPLKSILLFLVVLAAVAVGFNGSSLSPSDLGRDARSELAEAPPTQPATPAPTSVPTQQPTLEPTSTSTPEPAIAPTLEPTDAPVMLTIPENTTDASIIVEGNGGGEREVAFTFDAGEGAGYTSEILDVLKRHGVHASFGLTGEWARQYPDLVQRMVDEGHTIFNHSESHLSWTGASSDGTRLPDDQRQSQVLDADAAVQSITGESMRPFWRPPYGDYDADGQRLLKELGYDYTFWWTCDSLAWNGGTAAEIADFCGPDTERTGPGAIILMHVSQEQDYLALDQMLTEYEDAGFTIVSMEEYLAE